MKGMDSKARDFYNELKPWMVSAGFDIKALSTPHASPRDTALAALWNISGQTGIPIRILTGEGSGQLAGSEDKIKYGAVINDRQNNECERYVNQLLKILSNAGLIKIPATYDIHWPKEEPTTELQEAELANKKADTLMKISAALNPMSGLDRELTPQQAVEEILGWDHKPDESDGIGEITDGDIDESDINRSRAGQADN